MENQPGSQPLLALYVQELNQGRIEGASRITGALAATAGIAGLLSSLVLGYLSHRHKPIRLCMFCACGGAMMMLAHGLTRSFAVLFPVRCLFAACAGGLPALSQIWLSRITLVARRSCCWSWSGRRNGMELVVAKKLKKSEKIAFLFHNSGYA